MPQHLHTILAGCPVEKTIGQTDRLIRALQYDSRKVQAGDVFFALSGTHTDGHQFIPNAVENGAVAVVCRQLPPKIVQDVTYLKVCNTAETMGNMAAAFYGHPAQNIKIVAFTGTNGKTSCVTLLHSLFTKMGYAVGLLSTIENKINNKIIPSRLTTPDALTINQLIGEMVEAGCAFCFMEASSHAIVQYRLAGLQLAGAVFTNISHDHLDYHQTFKNYINAKKLLFDRLPPTAFALVNTDDKRAEVMLQNCRGEPHTYALKNMADFKAKLLEETPEGLCLEIAQQQVWFRLTAAFNAYNLLAVFATARLLGQKTEHILPLLSDLRPVNGRFERLPDTGKVNVWVDYAHTPDALEQVLRTLTALKKPGQALLCVVGCGGNRDKAKRPLMGKIAAQYSDRLWLTSDNPRSEPPAEIIAQISTGIPANSFAQVEIEENREKAIFAACAQAKDRDLLLIAGKGHENYQEINGIKYPFDDKIIVQQSFQTIAHKKN